MPPAIPPRSPAEAHRDGRGLHRQLRSAHDAWARPSPPSSARRRESRGSRSRLRRQVAGWCHRLEL